MHVAMAVACAPRAQEGAAAAAVAALGSAAAVRPEMVCVEATLVRSPSANAPHQTSRCLPQLKMHVGAACLAHVRAARAPLVQLVVGAKVAPVAALSQLMVEIDSGGIQTNRL